MNNEEITMNNTLKKSFSIEELASTTKDSIAYENLIYNKKESTINLFKKLDKEILSISEYLNKNYLTRNVAYKLDNKILEVQINQNNLLATLHKEAKQFDNLNKLNIKKGYENTNLCYCVTVENEEDIFYVKDIVNNLCNYLKLPKEDMGGYLLEILSSKILNISEDITTHNTNKGLVFKSKRNFAIINKTNYGLYLRILNVNNQNNILDIVTRKFYEPLCLSYKIYSKEDVSKIFSYVIESYNLSKINPVDLKNGFYKLYYAEAN